MDSHGTTSPCMACATNKQKKWFTSRKHMWLEKAGLKEALIMAAQEQALNTRSEESAVHRIPTEGAAYNSRVYDANWQSIHGAA